MKQKSLILTVLMMLVLALAACAAPAAAPSAPAAAPATDGEAASSGPTYNEAGYRTDLAGTTIKYIGDSMGASFQFEQRLAAEFEEQTGIKVEMIEGAQSATERLAQYLQQLGAQSSDIDVYRIDVIWPGILEPHAVDLSEALAMQNANYFERIVANNTVGGKLVGIPIYVGAGLLYYRTDLLEKYGYDGPPQTWAELEEMAKTIQEGERAAGNPDFWG
jgi:trehalose/maltose transport system substrate-binding protein